jgi:hypothetical protein
MVRYYLIVCVAMVGAALTGCANEAPEGTAASMKRAKPGPEESFKLIVDTFRRGVEDVPINFVVRQEHGHSMMVGKNDVRHTLIPPSKEDDPYKAIITVDSKSSYSIQKSGASEEDDAHGNRSEEPPRAGGELANDPSGLEVFDSDLVNASPSTNSNRSNGPIASEPIVRRRADDWPAREYELEYRNGRWELLTKLDPETEQSIQNAFDQALRTQI